MHGKALRLLGAYSGRLGVGALKLAIERGVTGTGQAGVKPGTLQAKIVERQIT